MLQVKPRACLLIIKLLHNAFARFDRHTMLYCSKNDKKSQKQHGNCITRYKTVCKQLYLVKPLNCEAAVGSELVLSLDEGNSTFVLEDDEVLLGEGTSTVCL